jgi:hypothetical protein
MQIAAMDCRLPLVIMKMACRREGRTRKNCSHTKPTSPGGSLVEVPRMLVEKMFDADSMARIAILAPLRGGRELGEM